MPPLILFLYHVGITYSNIAAVSENCRMCYGVLEIQLVTYAETFQVLKENTQVAGAAFVLCCCLHTAFRKIK